MTRRRARAVVVDASVAASAGGAGATQSEAIACRDALKALLEGTVSAVMTSTLKNEWREHRSTYAHKWLLEMHGRRRVIVIYPPLHEATRAKMAGLSNGPRKAVQKDLHLVEAALATDKRVASRDDAVRSHFCSLCITVTALRHVQWVNPASNATALAWFRDGCPDAQAHLLRVPG
jgi:hypothetical protein